jgi:hypothetical protein
MTGHTSVDAQRAYYNANYRNLGVVHQPEQRVIPPADVERREFSAPCFFCEERGPCRHRRR